MGRRTGLKILGRVTVVSVRVRPSASKITMSKGSSAGSRYSLLTCERAGNCAFYPNSLGEPPSVFEKITLTDDMIAVKDDASIVSRHLHRCPLGNNSPHYVPRSRSAEAIEEVSR